MSRKNLTFLCSGAIVALLGIFFGVRYELFDSTYFRPSTPPEKYVILPDGNVGKLIEASVTFFLSSSAEILVTDPQGHTFGKDPRTGTFYNQIPEATYEFNDPIVSSDTDIDTSSRPRSKQVHIPLSDGVYKIQVIGTENGSYELTAIMGKTDSVDSTKRVFTAFTSPNAVTSYVLTSGTNIQDITVSAK